MSAATVTHLPALKRANGHALDCQCAPCLVADAVAAVVDQVAAAVAEHSHGPRLVTIKATGPLLGVSRELVYRLIRRGDLETVRIDGCHLVVVESIDRYVARLRTEASA